jgi:hypothetical protein
MRRYGLALLLGLLVVLGGVYFVSVVSRDPSCEAGVLPVPAGCPGYEINNTDN